MIMYAHIHIYIYICICPLIYKLMQMWPVEKLSPLTLRKYKAKCYQNNYVNKIYFI